MEINGIEAVGHVQLHNGDCIRFMQSMAEGSVDAIIADPPYGINYQAKRGGKLVPKIANDVRPFIWWLHEGWRVVRDGGSIVCFCRHDVQDVFQMAIEAAGFVIKSQIIWSKGGGGRGDLQRQFAPEYEVAWFATKGNFKFWDRRPMSVIHANKVPSGKQVHPNEKPVRLMSELVTALVAPGGVVLDPFMGSGPVGVACVMTQRKYVGCESDLAHFELASERIKGG